MQVATIHPPRRRLGEANLPARQWVLIRNPVQRRKPLLASSSLVSWPQVGRLEVYSELPSPKKSTDLPGQRQSRGHERSDLPRGSVGGLRNVGERDAVQHGHGLDRTWLHARTLHPVSGTPGVASRR